MLKLVCLLLCLTSVLAAVPHSKLPLAGHKTLMNFMVQSRVASQENPARSLDCFNHYVPILNEIVDEYERNYGACMKSAEQSYDQIDGRTKPQRNEIESDAQAACNTLANCVAYQNSIDYFGCFNVEGSYNSKTMYNISANAGEVLLTIREQYRLVETDQFRCTNASERAYVENTTSTYEELQACLQGRAHVPPPMPTTAEPTTIETEPTTIETEPTTEETTEVPTTPDTGDGNNDDDKASRESDAHLNEKWQSILGKFKRH